MQSDIETKLTEAVIARLANDCDPRLQSGASSGADIHRAPMQNPAGSTGFAFG